MQYARYEPKSNYTSLNVTWLDLWKVSIRLILVTQH